VCECVCVHAPGEEEAGEREEGAWFDGASLA